MLLKFYRPTDCSATSGIHCRLTQSGGNIHWQLDCITWIVRRILGLNVRIIRYVVGHWWKQVRHTLEVLSISAIADTCPGFHNI